MPEGRVVGVGGWGVASGLGPAGARSLVALALVGHCTAAAAQPAAPTPAPIEPPSTEQPPTEPSAEPAGPGLPAPAEAEPDPEPAASPELLAQAKVLFRAANEARRGGELREAIRLFARSRSIYPSVPNTLNAALCHAELGEVDRALELYERLYSDFAAELGTVQLTSLAERIEQSRGEVGRLEVSADLEGTLFVDGVERARLPSPRASYLLPGARVIRLVRPNAPALELRAKAEPGASVRFDRQTARPVADVPAGRGVRTDGASQAGAASPGARGVGATLDGPMPGDGEANPGGPVGLWLAPDIGVLLGTGLGSGAERHCGEACESATTVGASVGLTLGYDIQSPLSLEVALRYAAATEERTRVVRGQFADRNTGRALSTVYTVRDDISWMGPLASIGLGARVELPLGLELGAHAHFGIGYFWASHDVEAAAASEGRVVRAALEGAGSTVGSYDLLALETVELGLRLEPVTLKVGLAAVFGLLDGPPLPTGDLVIQEGACERPGTDVIDCAPGNDALAGERAWGPFVLWDPFLSASFPF